jgi:hypothetical protein
MRLEIALTLKINQTQIERLAAHNCIGEFNGLQNAIRIGCKEFKKIQKELAITLW